MGLAQKGGSVTSHIIIAPTPEEITATHIAAGRASLLLGCDMVTAAANTALERITPGKTKAIINTHAMMSGDFARDRSTTFPGQELQDAIAEAAGVEHSQFINATNIAEELLGNTIGANMFMLGFAWQSGAVPIPLNAIEQAIELNGQAVEMNTKAFLWGRRAATDQRAVESLATPAIVINTPEKFGLKKHSTIEDIIKDRTKRLIDYQNQRYAQKYNRLVTKIVEQEKTKTPGLSGIAENVAKYLFKLMAYKDEYEVARLHSNGSLQAAIEAQFEGDYEVRYHMAPPVISRKDKITGRLIKREFGPSMQKKLKTLAKLKFLRGTPADVFGFATERRAERAMIKEYISLLELISTELTPANHALAVQLTALPDQVRGYGHVKMESIETYNAELEALRELWPAGISATTAA